VNDLPFRVLPAVDETNQFFWTSGRDGRLRFLRCQSCGHYLHPPGPRCPRCGGTELRPEPVSGRATVATFTVNHQQWALPEDPWVVAIVEMPEQEGLRLTTNIVGPIEDVAIGQEVTVVFEHRDDVWIPLFRPSGGPR
jgi:uncharacterized protein